MPLPPSAVQLVAELTRHGSSSTTLINPAHLLRLLATTPLIHDLDDRAHEGLRSVFHYPPHSVPAISCRGQKGIPPTYRVSPQQVATGHFVAAPDLPSTASKPTPATGLNCPRPTDASDVSPDSGPRNLRPKTRPLWTTAIRTRRKGSERLAARHPANLQLLSFMYKSAATGPRHKVFAFPVQ